MKEKNDKADPKEKPKSDDFEAEKQDVPSAKKE